MPPLAAPPKVFVSYSWTSPEYMARVLELAERLVLDEVDVILDRWHLQPGNDAFDFMERAVKDPTVRFVLILCDPAYVAKANVRAPSGVGTETLIISPAVYEEAQARSSSP